MQAFIRQTAVLSMLWAVCELLVPEGKQQMVRMTVSVLVMTALLSTVGEWLQIQPKTAPALAQQVTQISQEHYRRSVLKAAANQTAAYCERFCQRAGYAARTEVFLRADGNVETIRLQLQAHNPLMDPEKIQRLLCDQLRIERERIVLSVAEAEGP